MHPRVFIYTILGVLETGLFVNMAEKAYFGLADGSVTEKSAQAWFGNIPSLKFQDIMVALAPDWFVHIRLTFLPGTGYPAKYVRWVFFSSRKYQIHWSIKAFIFYFSKRIEKSNINNYVLRRLSGKSNRISGWPDIRWNSVFLNC